MVIQVSSVNGLSREIPPRRRYIRSRREVLQQSRLVPNDRLPRRRPFVVTSVTDAHESEDDEKIVDIGARESYNLAVRGFTEKVRMLSGPLTYVTEIVVDIVQRRWSEEEAAIS